MNREIDKKTLSVAQKSAWSIENREAHEAEDRQLEYAGSTRSGDIVMDYYIDSAGQYWYETCGIVNGQKVSMDMYLFGRKIKKKRKS